MKNPEELDEDKEYKLFLTVVCAFIVVALVAVGSIIYMALKG